MAFTIYMCISLGSPEQVEVFSALQLQPRIQMHCITRPPSGPRGKTRFVVEQDVCDGIESLYERGLEHFQTEPCSV